MTFSRRRRAIGCLHECAEAALRPLAHRFELAELFWQSRVSQRWVLEGGTARRSATSVASGVHVSGVAEDRALHGWSSDLSARGVVRALEPFGSRPKLPTFEQSLPRLEEPQAHRFMNTLSEAVREARKLVGSGERLVVRATLVAETRGVVHDGSAPVEWSRGPAHLSIDSTGTGGLSIRRSVVLPRVPGDLVPGILRDVEAASRNASMRLATVEGCLPVVAAPGVSGAFFHEIVGHPLEADHVLAGASPFAEMAFRCRVAPSFLTVIDRPSDEAEMPLHELDDQGIRGSPVVLIGQGRLTGMLHCRATARATGRPVTGNGRREDFRYGAEPRMRNLAVEPGPHDPHALVACVRLGLYVTRIVGGVSRARSGSFLVHVRDARLIRRGRLCEGVRNVVLRGDILRTLQGIAGVGDDAASSPEPLLCEKLGSVETSVRGPTVHLGVLEIAR